jgi:hypothetical protein
MQDVYLKFESESQANSILYEVIEYEDPTNESLMISEMRPLYQNIDTLGIISEPTGETTIQDDVEVPIMQAIPGWHVNVRLVEDENLEALIPYQVFPTVPRRVWA